MYWKQKGNCFRVFFIFTIIFTALPPVGRCKPHRAYQLNPHPVLQNVKNSALTTQGLDYPAGPEEGEPRHLDSQHRGQESRRPRVLALPLQNRNSTQTRTSSASLDQGVRPRTAPSSNPQISRRLKQTEESSSPLEPSDQDCSEGEIKRALHGKFYVVGQLEPSVPNTGFQSDSAGSAQAAGGQARTRGQQLSGSEESWQRLQPVVECGDDTMTLIVRRRRAAQLLLDRANESSVPLSQLPPQCGYSVQTTWRDLSLMAQYDACHVTQEGGSYVLPLLWRGTPVRMSCPVLRTWPGATGLSAPCCSEHGLTVKVQGLSDAEELRINVRGEWTPLVLLAQQCDYTLDRQDAETVITAPFLTCGITVKGGKYTLSLQREDKTFKLSCPLAPPEEVPLTHQPSVDSPHLWTPPFYLAPPYYPHPTFHYKYPQADVHDAHNHPTHPSSTPDPVFGPQPADSLPNHPEYYSHQIPVRESYKQFGARGSLSSADEMKDSGWGTRGFGASEKHRTTSSPTGFPVQVEAPSPQPPSHAFNPYYHYYHHPKIPLPGPTQDPDPGPKVPERLSPADSHTHKFLVQQYDTDSQQFHQPEPEAASYPYINPVSPKFDHKAPAPRAPSPHHYFYYFPLTAKDEAKSLAPLHHDKAAKTNLPHVHPLSHSSVPPGSDTSNMNPHIQQLKEYEIINIEKSSLDWINKPLLSEDDDDDDVKPEEGDEKRHSTYPPNPGTAPPSLNYNLPPYPYYYYYYYYHPYYYYNQMYYRPESLQSDDNRASPTSSKEALDEDQAFSFTEQLLSDHKHQTTSLPTESTYDVQNGHQHPYYYYYHFLYQPAVSRDNQEPHLAASMDSEKASSQSESQLPSESDHSKTNVVVNAAETGYPSIPQHQHPYFAQMTQQHPYDPFRNPLWEEERLDNKMRDCVVGQDFILTVPDFVVEPTVAPPAHPSDNSNVSCTWQRLTSDSDIYIVTLNGCGTNKHVFGFLGFPTEELLAAHSVQQEHETSPVGMVVECSSCPDSPGEMRLHVMDWPPPPPIQSTPATTTVQLRIATNGSFTSYHPEAHLPLSLLQGRPLYLEVSLLDPPEPDLVLLVHSCLAYIPYTSWMPIYNSCPSRGDSQLLPSPHSDSHHIRRIVISSFLSLPSESPSNTARKGSSLLEDPEIYFLCWTAVCSTADSDCAGGCINSPSSDM